MKNKKNYLIPLFFFFINAVLFTVPGLGAVEPDDFPGKGTVVESVVCRHDSSQSYALYLPTAYSPGRAQKWPLLFTFDPAGRPVVPVELFKNAAERFNYIVVCPTNSQNGPRDIIMAAMKAVWKDVCARFAVDKQRIYAAGYSGGARVSTFLRFVIDNPVRGVIACGAGLSTVIKPYQVKGTDYFGIAGFADFNYREMRTQEETLREAGVNGRFYYFDAKHAWPPESVCNRAVQWQEIMAVKHGLVKRNDEFINEAFQAELKLTQQREDGGDVFFAAADYEALAQTFDGLMPAPAIDNIRQKITGLKASKSFKTFQKDEAGRLKKEKEYLNKFVQMIGFLKHSSPQGQPLSQIMRELDIKRLQRQAKNKKNIYDAGLAERLLYNLGNRALEDGVGYLKSSDRIRAEVFLEIAAACGEGTWFHCYAFYNLAALHASRNNTKKALKYLHEAVDTGFNHLDHMENDKDLASIRDTAEFKEIVKRLNAGQKN